MTTYEEAFQQLEAVLAKLEQGDLPLDESLKQYEEGVRALRRLTFAEYKHAVFTKFRPDATPHARADGAAA